ncbi:MAG: NAD-dependent epimerase/dehydratase family protein [Deltaproteobacteria bacterium]|nr:NAD-dependent epimerase/dehydratase family protein [Deltaproteobacteria bacterium]MBW2218261.1 NAD-dependent epimerase/dehydratase family protein [Deltaproteobacteria bacterium]
MKNILITGASGYLGTRLVKQIGTKKDIGCIVGVDIVHPVQADENLLFYKKDIRDPGIGELMSEHNIDTVFHLAFVVKPIHDLKLMHDIDYNGTLNVLNNCHEKNVRQVIATSSTLAYGAHKDNPEILTEEDPLRGNKTYPYGYNKALSDILMQDFSKQHPDIILTILRPCTVFGPSVNNYVSRMLFMPVAASVLGYNPRVQFIHEDDFVNACMIAMEKQATGAFNITGDGTLTIRDIANMIGTRLLPVPAWILYPKLELLWRLHCPGIEVNSGYLDYARYPFIAGNNKAKQELGFYPKYDSKQTLEITAISKKRGRKKC